MGNPKEYTGLFLEFVDYDEEIQKVPGTPILLNDLPCVTKEEKDRIGSLIRTNYDGDKLSIQPSCECGATTSGKFCPSCRQPVLPFSEKPLIPNIWFRAPVGVPCLMNPTFWGILRDAFTHNSYCLLDWITKTTSLVPANKRGDIIRLEQLGVKRGYTNFVHNFDAIMHVLFNNRFYHGTAANKNNLIELIAKFKHRLFCRYLPIPHKIAFVTERTSVATYADFSVAGAHNAAITIAEIDEGEFGHSLDVRNNWTISAINDLTGYYNDQYKMTIGKKEGANRKHIVGTRGGYGGRAVISSLSRAHDYRELHIPWTYAVAMLKMHLSSKLQKRGMSPHESATFLILYAKKFHPLLDELFKELINEAKDEELGIIGIPSILQRNPSLARGSAQCFSITKIKTDINDNTISMSVLVLKAPNADFDGKHASLLSRPDFMTWTLNSSNYWDTLYLMYWAISIEVLLMWDVINGHRKLHHGNMTNDNLIKWVGYLWIIKASRVGRKCVWLYALTETESFLKRNEDMVSSDR